MLVTNDYIVRTGPGMTLLYMTRASLGTTVAEANDRCMAYIKDEAGDEKSSGIFEKEFFIEMADLEVVSGLWDGVTSEEIDNGDGTTTKVSNPMVPRYKDLMGNIDDPDNSVLPNWLRQSPETETFQVFVFVPGYPRKYTLNEHRQMLLLELIGV